MMLRAWLYRITLNVVRNRLRRNREVTVGRDLGTLLSIPDAGAGERQEDVMEVLATLGRLPERQRVALALRYLQDLPYAEICAVTGWSGHGKDAGAPGPRASQEPPDRRRYRRR